MNPDFQPEAFRYDGSQPFAIRKAPTRIDDLYADKDQYEKWMDDFREEINTLQTRMYAHNRYGLLLIFQAMDAGGKDGTIGHVMSGVNPFGLRIHNFKRPSETELDHDFLWRSSQVLPERGTIGIFNRSYYEEVLVVKVHPTILTESQRIPEEFLGEDVWKNRYEDIRHFETYLHRNGFRVLKFFLHVSKKEQGERLIERIEDQSKNWKFEEGDIKEREHWDAYQRAFEAAINATATPEAPWLVIPADDKKNMRLLVSQYVLEALRDLPTTYPKGTPERQQELRKFIEIIRKQDEG